MHTLLVEFFDSFHVSWRKKGTGAKGKKGTGAKGPEKGDRREGEKGDRREGALNECLEVPSPLLAIKAKAE